MSVSLPKASSTRNNRPKDVNNNNGFLSDMVRYCLRVFVKKETTVDSPVRHFENSTRE